MEIRRTGSTPRNELHQAFLAMTRSTKKEGVRDPIVTVKFPRAGSPECRYLRDKVARQIFDDVGNIRSVYPNTVHSVARASKKEFDLHFKALPTDPFTEYAVYSLLDKIKVGLAPPVELASFEVILNDQKKTFPVLLSQTAGVKTLKNIALEELDGIDRCQWTWQILCAFLVYPRDGRAEHYVLKDGKILAIGNENSLRQLQVPLISALFFLFPQDASLERSVLKEFFKLDLGDIFIAWINDLIVKVKEYESLLTDEQRKESQYLFKLILGLTDHFELRLKAHKIQNLILEALKNDSFKDMTAFNLLKLLECEEVYLSYSKQNAGSLDEKLRGGLWRPTDFDDPKLRRERLNPLEPTDFNLFLFEELSFGYQALKILILGIDKLQRGDSIHKVMKKARRQLPSLEDLRSEMSLILRERDLNRMLIDLKKTDEQFIYDSVIEAIGYFLRTCPPDSLVIRNYDFSLSTYFYYGGILHIPERIYDDLFSIKVENLERLQIEDCKNLNAGKFFRGPNKQYENHPNLFLRERYPNLKFLKISKTQVFSRMLEIVAGDNDIPTHVSFPSLQYLHISECPDLSFVRVRGPQLLTVEVFENKSLFTLDIIAPSCTKIDTRSPLDFFRIIRKSLENEDLRDVPDSAGIEWLDLSSCPALTLEGMQFLQRFRSLTQLDLSENQQIGDESLQNLRTLRLTELSLNRCRSLTDRAVAIVRRKFLRLRILRLNGLNRLTDSGLYHLQALQLEKLSLEKCQFFTDRGLKFLESISTLLMLNIKGSGRGVTVQGINRLKHAVSDLRILTDLQGEQ